MEILNRVLLVKAGQFNAGIDTWVDRSTEFGKDLHLEGYIMDGAYKCDLQLIKWEVRHGC